MEIKQKTPAYAKSKLLAEWLAWDYIKNHNNPFEIVTINPGFILGPILVKSPFTSEEIIYSIMIGKYPALPNIYMPVVDVRDVAAAHLRALNCTPN